MDCPEAVILKIDIDVPEYVREIAGKLVDSGYQAYVVGGAVRDSLIGRTPSDWDISSSATPREVEKIFGDRAIPTGERFGTMTVLSKDHAVEVTTFRCESRYSDGRRPDMVIFSESLRDDVARRDFTINALAYDIGQGTVTDYFGGMNDLKEMTIRTVGKPRERFTEDSLRMLRAIRFAVELGFGISPETLCGIAKLHSTIRRVSPERIQDELSKMLLSTRPGRAMEYSHETHLLDHI
ncbi:MAG: polynucleotide adenylyltransferase, partial [Firmicutes bacterium]|nr:polynucleotide adenylyltransferase [Bacillota bacterium]